MFEEKMEKILITVRGFFDADASISFAFRFTGTTGFFSGMAIHHRRIVFISVNKKICLRFASFAAGFGLRMSFSRTLN